jgi:hypothetical protein
MCCWGAVCGSILKLPDTPSHPLAKDVDEQDDPPIHNPLTAVQVRAAPMAGCTEVEFYGIE